MNGTILANRYLLDAQIGAGGMGAVYRATDLRTGGAVAVKFLHAVFAGSGEFAERLQREAQLAASLTSPRVVRVIDLDTHGGAPFLVMEYVAGPTLQDLLDEAGRLPPAEAVRIALEVARALEAAHARGIVHRDLKPQNIKLVEGQVKVLDFGIARAEGYEGMTSASMFMGTPEYSAPEQLEGRADIRADIYAVGLLLYRMVEGRLPFIGPTPLAVLNMQASAPLPPAAAAPPALAAVIDHCLEKRPEDRYQTPAELVAALHGVTLAAPGAMAPLPVDADGAAVLPPTVVGARPPDGGASTAPPSGAGERRPPPRPSRRRLLVGAGWAVGAVAALLALRAGDGDEPEVAAAAPASDAPWYYGGYAQAGADGAWRFDAPVARDLIGERFIRTRVTSGACDDPKAETVFFEGTVPPSKLGADSWDVPLRPSRAAVNLPRGRQVATAHLSRSGDGGTRVTVALDSLPRGFAMNPCFRQQ